MPLASCQSLIDDICRISNDPVSCSSTRGIGSQQKVT